MKFILVLSNVPWTIQSVFCGCAWALATFLLRPTWLTQNLSSEEYCVTTNNPKSYSTCECLTPYGRAGGIDCPKSRLWSTHYFVTIQCRWILWCLRQGTFTTGRNPSSATFALHRAGACTWHQCQRYIYRPLDAPLLSFSLTPVFRDHCLYNSNPRYNT